MLLSVPKVRSTNASRLMLPKIRRDEAMCSAVAHAPEEKKGKRGLSSCLSRASHTREKSILFLCILPQYFRTFPFLQLFPRVKVDVSKRAT